MPFKPSSSQAQEYQRKLLRFMRSRMRRGVESWYKLVASLPFLSQSEMLDFGFVNLAIARFHPKFYIR